MDSVTSTMEANLLQTFNCRMGFDGSQRSWDRGIPVSGSNNNKLESISRVCLSFWRNQRSEK